MFKGRPFVLIIIGHRHFNLTHVGLPPLVRLPRIFFNVRHGLVSPGVFVWNGASTLRRVYERNEGPHTLRIIYTCSLLFCLLVVGVLFKEATEHFLL